MVAENRVLVRLVSLVDRIPLPPVAAPGAVARRSILTASFSKAPVIMIVRRFPRVHTLPAILAEPSAEMQQLRTLLCEQGRFPCRRTWERRLATIPETLPAQISCLGRHLVTVLAPWGDDGPAAAIDR